MGERYSLSACIYGAVFVEGFGVGNLQPSGKSNTSVL